MFLRFLQDGVAVVFALASAKVRLIFLYLLPVLWPFALAKDTVFCDLSWAFPRVARRQGRFRVFRLSERLLPLLIFCFCERNTTITTTSTSLVVVLLLALVLVLVLLE